jgi:hypothetical protein
VTDTPDDRPAADAAPPDGWPDGVETEAIAGVPVPTSCANRVDAAALRAAVAALDEHGVRSFWVSPSGGLKCRVGARRLERVQRSLRAALAEAGHGVTDHGVRRGFRRLRVGLVSD